MTAKPVGRSPKPDTVAAAIAEAVRPPAAAARSAAESALLSGTAGLPLATVAAPASHPVLPFAEAAPAPKAESFPKATLPAKVTSASKAALPSKAAALWTASVSEAGQAEFNPTPPLPGVTGRNGQGAGSASRRRDKGPANETTIDAESASSDGSPAPYPTAPAPAEIAARLSDPPTRPREPAAAIVPPERDVLSERELLSEREVAPEPVAGSGPAAETELARVSEPVTALEAVEAALPPVEVEPAGPGSGDIGETGSAFAEMAAFWVEVYRDECQARLDLMMFLAGGAEPGEVFAHRTRLALRSLQTATLRWQRWTELTARMVSESLSPPSGRR